MDDKLIDFNTTKDEREIILNQLIEQFKLRDKIDIINGKKLSKSMIISRELNDDDYL